MKRNTRLNVQWEAHAVCYGVVLFFLCVGTALGAVLARGLPAGQEEGICAMLLQSATARDVLERSALNHTLWIGAIWCCGLASALIPVMMAVVLLRGAALGFAAGMLFRMEAVGMADFCLRIFPQSVLILPVMVVCAVSAVTHARRARAGEADGVRYVGALFLWEAITLLLSAISSGILLLFQEFVAK